MAKRTAKQVAVEFEVAETGTVYGSDQQAQLKVTLNRKTGTPLAQEYLVAATVHRIAAEVFETMAKWDIACFAVCTSPNEGRLWLEGRTGRADEASAGLNVLNHAVDAAGFA